MSVGGEVVRFLYSWPPSRQPAFAGFQRLRTVKGMCYIGSSFLVLLILAAFRSTAIYFGCAVAVGLIFFAYLQPLPSKVICVTACCCMLTCENKKRGSDDRVLRPLYSGRTATRARGFLIFLVFVSF